jgi:hypothetical protein
MSESLHSAKSRRTGSSRRSSSSSRSLNYFTPDSYDNKLVENKKLVGDLIDKQIVEHKRILDRLIKSNKFYKKHKHDRFSRSALSGLRNTRTQSFRIFKQLKSHNNELTRKLKASERGDFLLGGRRTRNNRK